MSRGASSARLLKNSFKYRTSFIANFHFLILFIYALLWIECLAKSFFFADDFTSLKFFWHDLKLNSGTSYNAGRYVTNLLFGLGSLIFGSGSSAPFEVLSGITLVLGLWLISFSIRKNAQASLWGLQIFTISLVYGGALPLLLWATGITHTASSLFTGLAIFSFHLGLSKNDFSQRFVLTFVSGIFWFLVVLSDPLYVGVLCIALLNSLKFSNDARRLNVNFKFTKIFTVFAFNIFLPILYFFLVARPATVKMSPYSKIGIQFLNANLNFYKVNLFWNSSSKLIFILIILFTFIVAISTVRISLRPFAFLSSGMITLGAILIQGQQREVFYTVLPFTLILTSLTLGISHLKSVKIHKLYSPFLLVVTVVLLVSGSRQASFFNSEPWGYKLQPLINEIAFNTAPNKNLAICFSGTKDQFNEFIGSYGGSAAFEIPPVNALSVDLMLNSCSLSANQVPLHIIENQSGFFALIAK